MPYKCMTCGKEFDTLVRSPYDDRGVYVLCEEHLKRHVLAMQKAEAYYKAVKRRSYVNNRRGNG